MINTWFKFEVKIQNTSKVIVFTRNHTDDDDADEDDGTKNNMSLPGRKGGGRRHNFCIIPYSKYRQIACRCSFTIILTNNIGLDLGNLLA